MENKEQDPALQASADKQMNYSAEEESDIKDDAKNKEREESRRQKHDADSGNEDFNEMLQKEKLIDPGNEHHQTDADSGGDTSGTVGPKPGEG